MRTRSLSAFSTFLLLQNDRWGMRFQQIALGIGSVEHQLTAFIIAIFRAASPARLGEIST